MGGLLEGPKGMLAPPLKLLGGFGGGGAGPPPLPTPMSQSYLDALELRNSVRVLKLPKIRQQNFRLQISKTV